MVDLKWQKDAACKDTGHDSWYAAEHSTVQLDFQTLARVCGACPVQDACLTHAVEHEEHGYWGGMSERAIRDLRKQNNIRLVTI